MARVSIRLDHKGIAELLKSPEFAAVMTTKSAEVAAVVGAHQSIVRHEMPVTAEPYQTDRAAAEVTIEHAGGIGVEAKYGALTRAATATGLEVTTPTEADARIAQADRARERRERERNPRDLRW
ncbi:hypothetical protein [Micromonospora okii]|uniref:hypothetical protein n=1 Tax=Micromonospora okii TaxID=1182970 RepID=UPI001E4E2E1E|nr:hypothetical protein [Micromonospora okii]